MDYIPLPREPVHEPIQVPYLGQKAYDGGDFEEYPRRAGWETRSAAQWQFHFQSRSKELQAFLQTWLFFGFIRATFAHIKPVTETHLTRLVVGNQARKILDTSSFPELIKAWLEYAEVHPQTGVDRFRGPLRHTGYLVALLQRNHAQSLPDESEGETMSLIDYLDYTPINPLSAEVSTSVVLLLELVAALNCTKVPIISYPGITPHTLPIRQLFRLSDSLITTRMRADGWCPYMVTLLHQRYNSTALSFVSNFERIGLAQDIVHTSSRSAGDPGEKTSISSPDQSTYSSQDLCSEDKCAKLQLKEEQYRTRHAGSCDQASCYEVVADPNEIHKILTDPGDSFPIICPRLDLDDSSQRIDLRTYRSDLDMSPSPTCGVMDLAMLAYEVSGQDVGSAYFWLDTICVPPDQARDEEAQQAALSRMRISYEAAEIVLVLDSWLQTQRMRNFPDSEVLLKILTSLWNTRLWTLQEGAVGNRLFFEFSGGFYDADAGLQNLYGEADLMVSFLLKPVIVQRYEDFRGLRKHHRSIDQIIALSHGLQSRSTSVAADEPLCLGTMLGLDVLKISKASTETRMRVFWSLVETIPASLFFYNGPRLEEEGFRWAPRSFLRQSFNGRTIINRLPSHTQEAIAVKTDRGLLAKFPGFILTVPTTWSICQMFWLLDEQRRLYSVVTHMDTVKGAVEYQECGEKVSSPSGRYKINP